jgi:hypothetical protein
VFSFALLFYTNFGVAIVPFIIDTQGLHAPELFSVSKIKLDLKPQAIIADEFVSRKV